MLLALYQLLHLNAVFGLDFNPIETMFEVCDVDIVFITNTCFPAQTIDYAGR